MIQVGFQFFFNVAGITWHPKWEIWNQKNKQKKSASNVRWIEIALRFWIPGIIEHSWTIYERNFLRNIYCDHVQPCWNNKHTINILHVNEFRNIY